MPITGKATVVTKGVPVQLGTDHPNGPLYIQTDNNTAYITYLGGNALTEGFPLPSGYTIMLFEVGNLGDIYIDADTNGTKVSYLYGKI